ncbi:unnamed protein product [Taenia asiatica]|uniref:ThiF domain-containing protein n=1 Tax=Taenia asiatica TaxID=60517 RepID=A0A0R3WF63_TAEAS|nr:unnamed protein product [Taenia asiatica]
MNAQDISEEEAALYDRQIRLWGLEAQSRLKKAKLLLIGLSPVAGEIIKNIVLSGIDTLTICDDKTVEYPSLKTFFEVNWHGNTNSPLTAKRMPKGFFLAQLISKLDCPISRQSLMEAWPRVAENLGVPTTLLSEDDFA